MVLSREEFKGLVAEALDGLPEEFSSKIENVLIIVQDEPEPTEKPRQESGRPVLLLGLYRGVPLTERSVFATDPLPDQIIIFQRSIERICRTRAQIVEQVRRTLFHEIAHHFGFSEERLRELGY